MLVAEIRSHFASLDCENFHCNSVENVQSAPDVEQSW